MGVRVYETEGFPEEALPLVGHDSSAGFFQHPRWMNAICKAYPRFRPICLVAEEEGVVVGVTPVVEIERFGLREVVSMPFGTHGGPVLSPEATPQAVKELNRRFVQRLRGPRTFRYEMTLLDPPQVLKDDILVACQEAIHDVLILLPRKGTGGKQHLAPLTQDGRGLPEHVNLNLT